MQAKTSGEVQKELFQVQITMSRPFESQVKVRSRTQCQDAKPIVRQELTVVLTTYVDLPTFYIKLVIWIPNMLVSVAGKQLNA